MAVFLDERRVFYLNRAVLIHTLLYGQAHIFGSSRERLQRVGDEQGNHFSLFAIHRGRNPNATRQRIATDRRLARDRTSRLRLFARKAAQGLAAHGAWWGNDFGRPELNLTCRSVGFVDFLPYVYRELGLSKQAISYRISDHYPLWTEFSLNDV